MPGTLPPWSLCTAVASARTALPLALHMAPAASRSGLVVSCWPPCLKRPSTFHTDRCSFQGCELHERRLLPRVPCQSPAAGTERRKTRERKKGHGSSNLISKNMALLGLSSHSRSRGFNCSQFSMAKTIKLLWTLSPPYVQSALFSIAVTQQ